MSPLDNSVGRARAQGGLVQVGAKLLETGELEERLTDLEGIVGQRAKPQAGRQ